MAGFEKKGGISLASWQTAGFGAVMKFFNYSGQEEKSALVQVKHLATMDVEPCLHFEISLLQEKVTSYAKNLEKLP